MNEKTKNRVVITGMGIVCPLGNDVPTMWDNILNCRSGMNTTTIFDASTYPTKFCAEVKNYDITKFTKNPDLHKEGNRHSKFVVGAVAQACKQAKIDVETENPKDGIDRRKIGVYLGAGEGSVDNENFFNAIVQGWDETSEKMDWNKWAAVAFGKMQPSRELEQEPNMPAAHVSMLTGARGPIRSCLTACAASTQAIGETFKILQSGRADVMIAGGAHSMIHPLGIMGFNRLTALSTRNDSPETASRPFTASRDGFVIGEGAAIVILETLESAKKRGVEILAEVLGYGSSSDAFRVTDMHEEARGAVAAMKAALKDAKLSYKDIDYVSTHGTSTSENDSIETLAIKTVFKEEAKNTPVSSIKSMMGHLIGAAGATELITCILAIRDNVLPPTTNLNDPDPNLDLDYVPNKPRKADVNIVMKESFGFGGQNNVVIIRRYHD
ncbi:MAG: beta-ketoacyl-[acyl-carrier-protein] synthase family protein [Planctomycetes bacterium]|nr:beta-ketoacyl-[acyl-carrier-protein] synthase family protein [Planctomycetota bacterium]MBU1517954.1 beta-ketoacyl-[acyl-carrier-protein] synthase family protein [Planctomycetota bacterium]MBU2457982.1 beta-ketoacyl-[acyl-carrier-protein] synthase family protein [Planctomycetota bacterium]MBU2595995.1 beta-ketoacyl-[acyl-carrier-protein] synthase family protein [Planctomycetota bacterium]